MADKKEIGREDGWSQYTQEELDRLAGRTSGSFSSRIVEKNRLKGRDIIFPSIDVVIPGEKDQSSQTGNK